MSAIERMKDLARRNCGRRDAQGNPPALADDSRMSSLEVLLPEDLEEHVQFNRTRLSSYVLLSEEPNTHCECRGRARNTKPKDPSHPGRHDPMDIGAFGKSKDKHGKGRKEARTARQEQEQEQGLN